MLQETSALLDSLRISVEQLAALLPRIAIASAVLLAGWLVARAGRRIVVVVCRWIRVDQLAEYAGIEGFLVRGGVQFTTVTLLGGIVYWLILFATFVALLNALGMPAGRELIDRLVRFVPNVIVAVAIAMFGAVFARFVGSLVSTYLNNVGSAAAEPLAAIARYAILVFVLAIAAEQLALRSEILAPGLLIAFGAICFGLALAFGLAGRHWAARVLERHWKK